VTVRSGAVVWLTGLSGAGKTTVATRVAEVLAGRGLRVEHLDGDVLRTTLGQSGFTRPAREAYLEAVGQLAARLEGEGAVVVASLISPYRASRAGIRARCRRFLEVFVSTSLEVCERRDAKGLYAKARRGQIPHFTGIDDPYEAPLAPDVVVDTARCSVDEAVAEIIRRFDDLLGRDEET
jgi:adenylylsulfate kinase